MSDALADAKAALALLVDQVRPGAPADLTFAAIAVVNAQATIAVAEALNRIAELLEPPPPRRLPNTHTSDPPWWQMGGPL